MSLTYNDLPSYITCQKLMMTSFHSPQTNLAIYKLVKELDFYYDALKNEHQKILMEVGEQDPNQQGRFTIEGKEQEFDERMAAWLAMEIGVDPKITPINLTLDDFADCVYHKDNRFWLSSAEIVAVLEFVKKVQEVGKRANE